MKLDVYTDGNGSSKVLIKTMGAYVPEKELGLTTEAYNEVIEFAISEGNYAKDFLDLWSHGEWSEIRKYYPKFDLTTEAQKHLIAASGGEQS